MELQSISIKFNGIRLFNEMNIFLNFYHYKYFFNELKLCIYYFCNYLISIIRFTRGPRRLLPLSNLHCTFIAWKEPCSQPWKTKWVMLNNMN